MQTQKNVVVQIKTQWFVNLCCVIWSLSFITRELMVWKHASDRIMSFKQMLNGRHDILWQLQYFHLWFWSAFGKKFRMMRSMWKVLCGPRITLPVDVKLSICRLPFSNTHTYTLTANAQHHTHHFISHFHKHNNSSASSLSQIIFMTLWEHFHLCVSFSNANPLSTPFKACLWWDKSKYTPAWKEKNPSPICAHFRLNMNWPKSPPVEAFLVSAGPGYLIWTQALGSPEFIQ